MKNFSRHSFPHHSFLGLVALVAIPLTLFACACNSTAQQAADAGSPAGAAASAHDFTVTDIEGNAVSLKDYAGKVIVFVNVASKCGFTKQYADIQAFYEQYADKGVVVLGFPANNFMGQEPGTDAEIMTFCSTNYNVTFPMFSKISVKGKDIHPLYAYLTEAVGSGINWNFNKIIVDKTGKPVAHFKSAVKPQDEEFMQALKSLL